MQRRPVNSSNLAAVGWEEGEQGSEVGQMQVEFRNGAVYAYEDVPRSEYENLLGASSRVGISTRMCWGSTMSDESERPAVGSPHDRSESDCSIPSGAAAAAIGPAPYDPINEPLPDPTGS